MIARRVRYECPKCKRRESHMEGCCVMPRICLKCKEILVVKDTSFGLKPRPKEVLDIILNLFK